jgi:hypothetical protein
MSEQNQNEQPPSLEDELATHNDAILGLVMHASDRSSVTEKLLEHLKIVRMRSLYRADKDEDGEANFETFEAYIEWLVEEARERLRAKKGAGNIKTGYKLINEAVVVGRLAEQGITELPFRRTHAQLVEYCPPELQARVWARSLEIANGRKIAPPFIVEAAAENKITIPVRGSSASSKLGKLRESWRSLGPRLRPVVPENLLPEFDAHHALVTGKTETQPVKSESIPAGQETEPVESEKIPPGQETTTGQAPQKNAPVPKEEARPVVQEPEENKQNESLDPFAGISAEQLPAAVRTDKFIFVKFNGRGQYISFSAGRSAPALGVGYRWNGERGVWELPVSDCAMAEIAMSNISALLNNWKEKIRAPKIG